MLHREILLPPEIDHTLIDALLEETCRREGLVIGLKAPLREYPGSMHWHWKRGKENGTLEATHWPSEGRLWLSVHENRAAPWTDSMTARLGLRLVEQLSPEVGTIFAECEE